MALAVLVLARSHLFLYSFSTPLAGVIPQRCGSMLQVRDWSLGIMTTCVCLQCGASEFAMGSFVQLMSIHPSQAIWLWLRYHAEPYW